MKKLFVWLFGSQRQNVFYIGGSDILPPPLKGKDEQDVLEQMEQGSEEAKQRLIEHNLRLVVFIARRFENTGINLEDLISIGTIGLIKAVGTYRRDKNIKLATYASRCIENEILMYIRKIANQKSEVSLDEPINMDYDGNELLLSDVLGTDEDMILRPLEDNVDLCILRQAVKHIRLILFDVCRAFECVSCALFRFDFLYVGIVTCRYFVKSVRHRVFVNKFKLHLTIAHDTRVRRPASRILRNEVLPYVSVKGG